MVRPPYPTVARLYGIAAGNWAQIDGEAALRGVDLIRLPLDRFCNAVYAYSVEHVEDREEFDYRLTQPVPGRVRDTDPEQELAEFAAFMAAMKPN